MWWRAGSERMQGRAGEGPSGLRSHPRALPPPVLPPPPQFATDQDEMPSNQIAQVVIKTCIYMLQFITIHLISFNLQGIFFALILTASI